MGLRTLVASATVMFYLAGCRRAPSGAQSPKNPARSVFNDSSLHVEKCLPNKSGEDWHRVCTPIDQSMPMTLPKPKPPTGG